MCYLLLKNNFSVACDPSCLNFVLFDVRPPDQFNQCHLQSTMHLETTDDGKKLVEQITNHIEGMNLIFFNNLTNQGFKDGPVMNVSVHGSVLFLC